MDFLAKQIGIDDEPEFVLDRYKHTEFLLVTTHYCPLKMDKVKN